MSLRRKHSAIRSSCSAGKVEVWAYDVCFPWRDTWHTCHALTCYLESDQWSLHTSCSREDMFDARCHTWLCVSLIQAAAVWDTKLASARLLWRSTKTQSPNKHFQSRAWQTLFNHRGSSSLSLAEQFKVKILSWWSKQNLFILSSIQQTFTFYYVPSA